MKKNMAAAVYVSKRSKKPTNPTLNLESTKPKFANVISFARKRK